MKKTLITAILALGLVSGASAETSSSSVLDGAAYSYTSFASNELTKEATIDGTYYSSIVNGYHQFTMVMVLDWDAFKDATSWGKIAEFTSTVSGSQLSLSYRTTSNTLVGSVHYGSGNANPVTSAALSNYVCDGLVTLSVTTMTNNSSNIGKIRYGLLNSNGESMAFWTSSGQIATTSTLGDKEYSNLSIGASTADTIKGLYIFNTSKSDTDITSLAKAANAAHAVPEPATATLSLLALAGLAARRRRK